MPTINGIHDVLQNLYNQMINQMINQMAVEGTALAIGNGYQTTQAVNAIVHTQVSAATAYIYGDTNGDSIADLMIKADGLRTFAAGDFWL